jgi:hypothetical protein
VKLTSMALTKSDIKKQMEPTLAKDSNKDAPRYPWGLELNLDESAIAKLGLDELPEVGESYTLVAKCDITSAASSKTQGGNSRRLGLQITAMALEESTEKDGDAAKTLYGDK